MCAVLATVSCKMIHEPAISGLIFVIEPLLRRNLRYLLIRRQVVVRLLTVFPFILPFENGGM